MNDDQGDAGSSEQVASESAQRVIVPSIGGDLNFQAFSRRAYAVHPRKKAMQKPKWVEVMINILEKQSVFKKATFENHPEVARHLVKIWHKLRSAWDHRSDRRQKRGLLRFLRKWIDVLYSMKVADGLDQCLKSKDVEVWLEAMPYMMAQSKEFKISIAKKWPITAMWCSLLLLAQVWEQYLLTNIADRTHLYEPVTLKDFFAHHLVDLPNSAQQKRYIKMMEFLYFQAQYSFEYNLPYLTASVPSFYHVNTRKKFSLITGSDLQRTLQVLSDLFDKPPEHGAPYDVYKEQSAAEWNDYLVQYKYKEDTDPPFDDAQKWWVSDRGTSRIADAFMALRYEELPEDDDSKQEELADGAPESDGEDAADSDGEDAMELDEDNAVNAAEDQRQSGVHSQ